MLMPNQCFLPSARTPFDSYNNNNNIAPWNLEMMCSLVMLITVGVALIDDPCL